MTEDELYSGSPLYSSFQRIILFNPKISGLWHADEMFIKAKGKISGFLPEVLGCILDIMESQE